MTSQLTKTQVKHIASLARLSLTAKEIAKYQKQLSSILDYFEKLKKLDTSKVLPTHQVTGLINVYNQDGKAKSQTLSQQSALSQAKETHNGYVSVPAIINKI